MTEITKERFATLFPSAELAVAVHPHQKKHNFPGARNRWANRLGIAEAHKLQELDPKRERNSIVAHPLEQGFL
jgi:hypothetical protein